MSPSPWRPKSREKRCFQNALEVLWWALSSVWGILRIVKTRGRNDKAGCQTNQNTNMTGHVVVGTPLGTVAGLEGYMLQRAAKERWAPKACKRPKSLRHQRGCPLYVRAKRVVATPDGQEQTRNAWKARVGLRLCDGVAKVMD